MRCKFLDRRPTYRRPLFTSNCYRIRYEVLEDRICPAVTFGFSSGILTVMGDDADNAVEISDFGDGRIAVVGDGQSELFDDVDEIFVQTLQGNDRVRYSNSKSFQIITPGHDTALHIDVGDGDDQIQFSDGNAAGPALRRRQHVTTLSMDMGRGNDGVNVDIHHDDQVDLDIRSSDGGDNILIGMLLPAVQKVRAANGTMALHLGAGGNLVNVQTRNFDFVDAAIETIASADRAGEAVPPDSFSMNFGKSINPSGQQLYFPGRLKVMGSFGDADDQLTIDSQGFEEVADQLILGGGNDHAHIRHRMFAIIDRTNIAHVDAALGDGADDFSLDLDGYHQVTTRVDAGAGDDLVQIDQQADHPDLFRNIWINQTELPMGPGDDRVQFASRGYDQVGLTADLGEGNDSVTVLLRRLANPGLPPSSDSSSLDVVVRMGAGDDDMSLLTHGYRHIATDLDTGPAGDGHDEARSMYIGKYLTLRPRPADWSSVALDGGNDLSEIVAIGYGSVDVQTEQTRQITVIQDI